MSRRSRFLGLWTAGWLFAFLLALLLRVGDLRVQWPALLVPVVWALVAWVRGRPRGARRPPVDDGLRPPEDDEFWPPEDDDPPPRTPPTRELPWLPEVPRDRRDRREE